ncbi:MAG TPA: hypothetical protein VJP78_08245, partial [Thermoleophilia bacterium]|nr:hypothetical protein [Thermoleophilia bacterium]
ERDPENGHQKTEHERPLDRDEIAQLQLLGAYYLNAVSKAKDKPEEGEKHGRNVKPAGTPVDLVGRYYD